MLYDKRWDKTETKPDVFSLEGLIAWLEKQPADEAYNYSDLRGECVICQYLTAHGEPYGLGYGHFLTPLLRIDIAAGRTQTFGAALDRARKALGERA